MRTVARQPLSPRCRWHRDQSRSCLSHLSIEASPFRMSNPSKMRLKTRFVLVHRAVIDTTPKTCSLLLTVCRTLIIPNTPLTISQRLSPLGLMCHTGAHSDRSLGVDEPVMSELAHEHPEASLWTHAKRLRGELRRSAPTTTPTPIA